MAYQLNKKIRDLKPYDPVDGNYLIRLDANESFLPVPDKVQNKIMEAVTNTSFNRYPDSKAAQLCKSFAGYYGVNPENVTAGNGSDELISIICGAFLMKGDTIVTLSPDFSMYKFYASITEASCMEYPKKPDLTIDVDELISFVNRYQAKMLLFSNPCNPTSLGLKKKEVRKLIASVKALVILDEAYMDFWDQSLLNEVERYDNLIILRTCSKAFGMAAIRLGFAIANPVLSNALKAVKSPYNVNAVTQKIGEALLNEPQLIHDSILKIKESVQNLYEALIKIESEYPGEMHVYPSVANFVLIRLEEAKDVYLKLLDKGIAVRFMGDFLRVSAGSQNENREFLKVFQNAISV